MPDNEQEHLSLAEEKIRHFLVLAEQILSLRRAMHERLEEVLTSRSITESIRNRVLIGLNLKALDCFDRLVVDARDRRGEASHHLKTMAECFVYSHWVSSDSGDTRARLLYAEGFRSRAAYHESLEETEHAATWREMQRQQIERLQSEWEKFRKASLEQLASLANTEEQYYKIYRLACEAAHMGDLVVYIPPHPQEPGLRLSDLSMLRAYTSLKFGIILACDLLHDASETLGMRADEQIDGLRERWRATIAIGPKTPRE
ncbi:MAG: DUF5677 domain-containing protein [Nitrospiraceae bacterium]